jgi:flagellar protein FlbD
MNGVEFVINAELIEFIESTPDTVITLTTGKKFVLKDSLDELFDKVVAYRKAIGTKIIYHNRPDADINLDNSCDK